MIDKRQRQRDQDARRGSGASRGYDADWYKFRRWFLGQPGNHVCASCGGFVGVGGDPNDQPVVDHIVPVSEAPHLRLVQSNVRVLHKRCHDSHTARTRGFGRKGDATRLKPKGCNADGSPIDQLDPWYGGGAKS